MDLNKIVDLDLTDQQSKQLIKLVPNENDENLYDEIEFRVFQLAKKLKKQFQAPVNTTIQSTSTTPVRLFFSNTDTTSFLNSRLFPSSTQSFLKRHFQW